MAPKRSTTASAPVGKKAKLDPVSAKCEEIVKAIHDADLPAGVIQMFSDAMPHVLAPAPRHQFQEEAVEMLARILSKIESGLKAKVCTADETKAGGQKKFEGQEADVSAAQKATESAHDKQTSLKKALAEKAKGFQANKAALSQAHASQEVANKDLAVAEKSKVEVDRIAEEMKIVEGSAPEESTAESAAAPLAVPKDFVQRMFKHIEIEGTLQTACPTVLEKAPRDRGAFDDVVVKQMRAGISKRQEELQGLLNAAQPQKEAMQATIDAAQKAFATAKQQQVVAATEYMDADTLTKAADADLAAAKSTLNSMKKEVKAADWQVSSAQAECEFFRDGPLAAFTSLREGEQAAPQAELPAAVVAAAPTAEP